MKKAIAALLTLALCLSLTGCFGAATEELYALPQFPEQSIRLQQLIDAEIDAGSEFAAPTSGVWRQSVQLIDLDGDGSGEALAFFRGADAVLRICIYQSADGDYAPACVIEGEGSAIGSIEYADLNGDGLSELIVAWQVGSGLRMLRVYSLAGWESSVLLTTDCTEFLVTDLNGDEKSELLTLRFEGAEGGSVSLHSFPGEGEPVTSTARLSTGLETLARVRTGYLRDETAALFVESSFDNGAQLRTDVFVQDADGVRNISLDARTGVSHTARDQLVYCADIDNDHVMEIPAVSALPAQSETEYYVLDWFSYDARGVRDAECSTYHCYSDSWYMTLPEAWRQVLTVRRDDGVSGERAVVFSSLDSHTGAVTDFLKIYTLTGENRHDRAQQSGRFVLVEDSTTIYAARILSAQLPELTEDEVKANFGLIYSEWITGAL